MGAVSVGLGVVILLPDWEAVSSAEAATRKSSRNSLLIENPAGFSEIELVVNLDA